MMQESKQSIFEIKNYFSNTEFFKRHKEHFIVLAIYLLLTLCLTFPVIANFTTYLAGDDGDGWNNLWNFWWLKKSLFEFKNPYFTDYIYQPYGTTLIFHDLTPINGLISLPFQLFFNLITAYNIVFIISFLISGFGMYLLAKYLTGSRTAAFLAGFMFMFFPYHMGHALGHITLMQLGFIPLFILFLIKTHKEGGIKNILLSAGFFVCSALSTFYYPLFLFLFSCLYFAYFSVREKRLDFKLLKNAALIFIVAFLVLSPLMLGMFSEFQKQGFGSGHNPDIWSADLLSFFIPGKIQTIGAPFTEITKNFSSKESSVNISETSNYLGYTILALAVFSAVSLWRKKDEIKLFACTAVISFILSLGTYLHVGGKMFDIPLPYLLLNKFIFVFSFSGVPERFQAMTMFSLIIISAYGIKILLERFEKRIVVLAVLSLVLVEFLALPFITTTFPVSNFYYKMASDKEDYSIIDLSDARTSIMYYQTIHNKKLINGYISRPPANVLNFIESEAAINHLLYNNLGTLKVNVTNKTDYAWNSEENSPMYISYHVYDLNGQRLAWDNNRTKIGVVKQNESRAVNIFIIMENKVKFEDIRNGYILEIDVVHEGVRWLAEKGFKPLKIRVKDSNFEIIEKGDLVNFVDLNLYNPSEAKNELKKYNVKYVIVHSPKYSHVAESYGMEKVYFDEFLTAYEVK